MGTVKKCQNCGKAPAKHHIKKWENNLESDFALCDACAEEKGTGGTWLDPEHGRDAGGASGQSCVYGGNTYEAGETIPADECNSCTCQPGGRWRCTLILCRADGGAAGASDGEAGTGGVASGEGGAGGELRASGGQAGND